MISKISLHKPHPRLSSAIWIAFTLALTGAAALVHAQVESGSVVGTVRDSSGAVVAGASITVTNTETSISRQLKTNGEGGYTVAPLRVGMYSVTVEHPGFKRSVLTGIKLDVNEVVRMDVTLAPGEVAERVEVTAAEPLVEADTSSIGQVIEENRVHELPLNGRNFISLAYLSPGVNAGPTGTVQSGNIPENERDNGAIQVNGLTATNNNYLLNGFDNNEQQIGFELIEPPIDAIQEFKVQTNNMSADIGKGGAVVNVVLKSGTNQVHGSAFEFLRNSWLDAKNFFDTTGPIPPFKRNEFGGTLGGPIVKDKTFFFVDYQGRRVRQSLTDTSTVPVLPISANLPATVTDPRTGQTLTSAQLDPKNANTPSGLPLCTSTSGPSCLDPAAVNVIGLFPPPSPSIPGSNLPGAAGNFVLNPVARNEQDSFDIRVDHQMTSRDSFFATFSYGNVDALKPDPFPGVAGGGPFTGNINNKALMGGLSDVHTFASNKVNELKIGYTRYLVDAIPFFTGQPIARQLGIPTTDPAIGGFPSLFISGFGFFGPGALGQALGNGDWYPEHLHENNYQLLDSFTYIKGNHAFKMGGDLRRRMHGFFQTQSTHGDIFFNGQFTGNVLADFLLGYSNQAAETGQKGLFGMRWWEFGSYFMDDFRVAPKLTLNLGLRYDIYTPQVEQLNRLANFNFATGMFVQPGVTPGVSRSGNVVTNYHNFSPRVGFAYAPWNEKTVLRGGYGIFYDLQANQNDAELAFNSTGLYGTQSILLPAGARTPVVRLFTGFETSANPSGALPFPTLTNPSGRSSAAFFNNPTTYIEEWNLNVERQLMKDTVLQVGYVGTHGVHLTFLRNLNQATQPLDTNFETCPTLGDPSCSTGLPTNFGRPYFNTVPNVAQIRTEGHDLSSITHSLQVRFERRFSANWSMLNSYTYQHTIGQTDEDEWSEPQNTYNMRAERGNLAPDYRHQFTSAWSYQLPFGPGQRLLQGTGPLHWLSEGWQVNGIVTMYSGQAFTPYLGLQDYTNTGSFGDRPDLVGNPSDFSTVAAFNAVNGAPPLPPGNPCFGVTQQTLNCWFNPAAFALPPLAPGQQNAHQFGNASRGSLRGPAFYNTDFSLFKNFKFGERTTLQLRGEVFNLFNTPQFAPPNNLVDFNAPSISSTVNNSRQIQLVARVTF